MRVEEVATCINIYRGAIDPSKFMIEVNNQDNDWGEIQWSNSSVGSGTIGNYRTSAEADISHLEKGKSDFAYKFQEISSKIMNEIVPDYSSEYLVHTSGYEGWRLLKYSGGAEYHAHYDHGPQNRRIISLVAFMQSPDDGGNLEFPYFGVNIDAIAGDVVVFPSNFPYTHIAHPVTSGTKCSLVTWFQ